MSKRKQTKSKPSNNNKSTIKQIQPLNTNQATFFDTFYDYDCHLLTGWAGVGKSFIALYKALEAYQDKQYRHITIYRPNEVTGKDMGALPGPQPLWSKVLTPNGWTTMNELKVGDLVVGVNGIPTEVLEVHNFENEKVYKIETTTGKTTYATGSHLWETKDFNEYKHEKPGKVRTTSEIADTLIYKNGKTNHYLPRPEPINFNSTKKDLHPYVLGILLGDGAIGTNSVSFSSVDEEIVSRVNELLLPINAEASHQKNTIAYNIKANDGRANKPEGKNTTGRYTNPVKQLLEPLGLLGKTFKDKFIPKSYIYEASIKDRMELLRGLLDADGTVHRGNAEFFSSSKCLVSDVQELVRSLGGSSHINERDRREKLGGSIDGRTIKPTCIEYCCMIKLPESVGNPFYLPRKASQYRTTSVDGKKLNTTSDRISNIEYHSTENVRCIKVQSERHLYITDDYIVTHNTAEEKMAPFETPYSSIVNDIYGRGDMYGILKKIGALTFESPSFARGNTFDDTVVIIDEFQNLTAHALDTLITRIGTNTKVIICGDLHQQDLRRNSDKDVAKALHVLQDMRSTSTIEFSMSDIVRSGFVKEYIITKHKHYKQGY